MTIEERHELFIQRYPELYNKLTGRTEYDKKLTTEGYMKRKAREIISVGKRNGSIKQKYCELCQNKKTEAHHDDYSKPKDVRWLCKPCHWLFHKTHTYNKKTSSYVAK